MTLNINLPQPASYARLASDTSYSFREVLDILASLPPDHWKAWFLQLDGRVITQEMSFTSQAISFNGEPVNQQLYPSGASLNFVRDHLPEALRGQRYSFGYNCGAMVIGQLPDSWPAEIEHSTQKAAGNPGSQPSEYVYSFDGALATGEFTTWFQRLNGSSDLLGLSISQPALPVIIEKAHFFRNLIGRTDQLALEIDQSAPTIVGNLQRLIRGQLRG